jgi:hypothetical protein
MFETARSFKLAYQQRRCTLLPLGCASEIHQCDGAFTTALMRRQNPKRHLSSAELAMSNFVPAVFGKCSVAVRFVFGIRSRVFDSSSVIQDRSYEAAVPIPASAEGAFSGVSPIGPISGWQSLTGQAYTQAGVIDLGTGAFTQTGVNWGQAAFYGIDASLMNAVPAVGTPISSSTGT